MRHRIRDEAPRLKLAFHLHAVRAYFAGRRPSSSELGTVLDWTAAEGFMGIDVSDSWNFENLEREYARRVRAQAKERGLEVATVSCMGKSLCHPEFGNSHHRALLHALDVAGWLESGVVNISLAFPREPGVPPTIGAAHSPGGSTGSSEADFAITAERLRLVAREAKSRGLSLSIELHDRGLADTSATLLRLLDEVGEPNVGSNPDLTNGYRAYDVPPEAWQQALLALAPRANLWHVNNMQRVHFPEIHRSAFLERPLGFGDIDYRWAMRLMRSAGFDGWVVIEHKGTGDPFECIAAGKRYLDTLAAIPTALRSDAALCATHS